MAPGLEDMDGPSSERIWKVTGPLQEVVAAAVRRLSTPVRVLRTPSKACIVQREGKHGLDDEPSLS